MISRRRDGGPITDVRKEGKKRRLTNSVRFSQSWVTMAGSTVGPAKAGSIGISCAPFRCGVSRSAEWSLWLIGSVGNARPRILPSREAAVHAA